MAILKIYDILLDIKRATTNNKIEVVEGDNGNVFRIFLTDNNEPVDLSNTRVVAVFSSGDGTAEQDTSDTPFGEYTLTFNSNKWVINSLRYVDDLALCGITLTGGTPVEDDTVTVTYNEDGATAVTSIAGATVTVDRATFAESLASVVIGGTDNNEIDILVRAGSYSSSGINECEIQIYSGDDDVLVTTAKFNFQSRRSSLNDETLVSEEKFPILVSLIAQVNDALKRAMPFTNASASVTALAPHSDPTASVTVGDDSVTFAFGIPLPNGIVSVTKSGTGAAGTKDTYTITFTDNTTFSFEVYNGADGSGSVISVNGKTGTVTLSASDVGADASGTASSAVSMHDGDASAHSSLFSGKQDTISDLATIRSGASDGATALTKATDKVLFLTNVACSAITGDFATVSDAKITADHVVAEITFSAPNNVRSDVTWTTASGSLILNGKCYAATTANIVLIKKDN